MLQFYLAVKCTMPVIAIDLELMSANSPSVCQSHILSLALDFKKYSAASQNSPEQLQVPVWAVCQKIKAHVYIGT